ncbi:DJ-1/PfpI family protein [Spirosoma sordidisoli]|uniref:DJ-1/PfpI family protein n=1 Tax=Spirosoma sordidisoli TaxID=2502893 RepID=A0A4Q2ULM8_9BACT|nr:DJ-1/PfpI family protein [Spirosoma sordidisoli]RYC70497.1 DJ-1/PfpI family protein [Spirosoma sordidisoli]
MRNVAILLFNEIEVLDFAGPFEVFGVADRKADPKPFQVYTVAERGPVYARNGLSINPSYLLNDHPKPDLLIIPGGGGYQTDGTPFGTRREVDNPAVVNWIRRQAARAELVLSVCTGSLLLAKAGLLDGLSATTHYLALDSLAQLSPTTTVQPADRWVDTGRIITSAGISAGIDMSLYVVGRLLGKDVADETARYMQYDHWV